MRFALDGAGAGQQDKRVAAATGDLVAYLDRKHVRHYTGREPQPLARTAATPLRIRRRYATDSAAGRVIPAVLCV